MDTSDDELYREGADSGQVVGMENTVQHNRSEHHQSEAASTSQQGLSAAHHHSVSTDGLDEVQITDDIYRVDGITINYTASPAAATSGNPGKRRFETDETVNDSKRQKVAKTSPRLDDLAVPHLQRIMTFLPLTDLARCLRVSHKFKAVLTESQDNLRLIDQSANIVDGEQVWQASRERLTPHLPPPLAGLSQRQMMKLLLAENCDCCHNRVPMSQTRPNVWQTFYVENSLRVIWHFGVVLCNNCFFDTTAKDVEVIITHDRIFLPGLPFVFRTSDKHYVPQSMLHTYRTSLPTHIQLSKVYYRPSLQDRREVYSKLQHDAPGEVNGWLQSLPDQVKRSNQIADIWNQWEVNLASYQSVHDAVYAMIHPPRPRPGFTPSKTLNHPLPARVQMPGEPVNAYGTHSVTMGQFHTYQPDGHHAYVHSTGIPTSSTTAGLPIASQHSNGTLARPAQNPTASVSPATGFTLISGLPGSYGYGPDAATILQERKAEIERRCYDEFSPPLYPNVLRHMAVYTQATNLPWPLTEFEWAGLKSQLFFGRLAAEEMERHSLAAINSSKYVDDLSARNNRKQASGNGRGSTERGDGQAQVRTALLNICDKVLLERWGGAQKILDQDMYNFAADIIVTTINKFREEHDASEFPNGHTITLDTVKHLFDNRIKARTEDFSKDLFLCNDCEDNLKYYSFDGMVQHYGAKHDPEFGHGNVIVAWHMAEWPSDDPPFKPQPTMGRRVPPVYAEEASRRLMAERARSDQIMKDYTKRAITPIRMPDRPSISATQTYDRPVTPEPSSVVPSFLAALRTNLSSGSGADPVMKDGVSDTADAASTPQKPNTHAAVVANDPSHPASDNEASSLGSDTELINPWRKNLKPPKPAALTSQDKTELEQVYLKLYKSTVGDIDDSVRIQTIIVNATWAFEDKVGKQLTPDLLREMINSPKGKPFRGFTGLICHLCKVNGVTGQGKKSAEVTKRSLKELLTHFAQAHSPQKESDPTWLTSMIELPDAQTLRLIPNLPGMTDEKLALIAAAVPPDVFGTTVPKARPAAPEVSSSLGTRQTTTPTQAGDNAVSRVRNVSPEEGEVTTPEAGEDEYNPQNPGLVHGPPPPTSRYNATTNNRHRQHQRHHNSRKGKPTRGDFYESDIPEVIRKPYKPESQFNTNTYRPSTLSTAVVPSPQVPQIPTWPGLPIVQQQPPPPPAVPQQWQHYPPAAPTGNQQVDQQAAYAAILKQFGFSLPNNGQGQQ